MTDVVQVQDATVRRGRSVMLDSVSFTVREGERWVVLGPNGAGKSTLIAVMAGRLFPTSGTADLFGERLGRVDVFELRPLIGLASAALAESVPAGERVLDVVVTAGYGVTGRWNEAYEADDEDRAAAMLEAFGVADLVDRAFGTLSTGERKRVASARALMTDPELLLLDEPASGLDLGGRESLVSSLSALAKDPMTPVTVLVTHHLEEIPDGYTHAALMRDGKITAAGPLDETLTEMNLALTYGMKLKVTHEDGRWSARAR